MNTTSARRSTAANLGLLAASTILSCAVGYWAWHRHRQATLGGGDLNVAAWEAGYRERGEPVPASGPREGWWGARLGKKVPDPDLHHHEPEVHLPGLVDIDATGLQHAANSPAPRHHVLLLGGSVAFGAYASSIENTYFNQALNILGTRGYPLALTIYASGSWTSFNETAAYRLHGVQLEPDLVVFLDGVNDLSQAEPAVTTRPVESYLTNMSAALDLSRRHGIPMVVVLQPLLPAKRFKTPLEERILQFPVHNTDREPDRGADWPQRYVDAFQTFRVTLSVLANTDGFHFVDCSDALSAETQTTFADFWHFPDPGHRLLARCLADGLTPILASMG